MYSGSNTSGIILRHYCSEDTDKPWNPGLSTRLQGGGSLSEKQSAFKAATVLQRSMHLLFVQQNATATDFRYPYEENNSYRFLLALHAHNSPKRCAATDTASPANGRSAFWCATPVLGFAMRAKSMAVNATSVVCKTSLVRARIAQCFLS